MFIIKGRVCSFVIVIFISYAVAKTVDVKPPAHEEVKVVSESGSAPDKADNSTSSLQEKWTKTAADKLHKIKKIDKEHLVSVDSNRNKTSLKANKASKNETNLKPDPSNFELTKDDVHELPLRLNSKIKDDKSVDTTNTTTISSSSNDPTTEFTVTSPSLILNHVSDNATMTNSTPVALSPNSNETVTSVLVDDDDDDKGSEYNFKDKLRPSFHPYMEEILSNGTSTDEDMPVIIKQADYLPSQIALASPHPYGNLPSFSEKDLGRLRLNHWRVKQILKGSVDAEAEKMGLPGSRKAILQSKYPYPILGQKRTLGEATYLDDSAADSLSSLLTSADQDRTPGQPSSLPPSNLRTFFSWFTNPSKIDPNSDPHRVELLQAQQAILPMALDYRGDFLFW